MNSDVIYKKMIFLDSQLTNKQDIVDYILDQALSQQLISSVDGLKKAVIAREEEVSTSIGFDIAMPHGKSEVVLQPFIAFLRTAKPIHWDETSDETVSLVFLIAVPSENKDNMHLRFISQISKKLLDDDFRGTLLIEGNSDNLYDLLKSIKTN